MPEGPKGQGTEDKGRDERMGKMLNAAEDADYKRGYKSGNTEHDAWVKAGRPKEWPVKKTNTKRGNGKRL